MYKPVINMAANNNIRNELEALMDRYGNSADIAKELRTLRLLRGEGDGSKRAKLAAALDKVLTDYGTITMTRFKKEATAAWKRAFPDGVEKREVKGYQLFVKENMAQVKLEHPTASHKERIAIIGRMWQESKAPQEPEPVDIEVEVEPEPVPRKRTRHSSRKAAA